MRKKYVSRNLGCYECPLMYYITFPPQILSLDKTRALMREGELERKERRED
jgi:hypothetical protein